MNHFERRRDHIETLEDLWRKESIFLEEIFHKRNSLDVNDLMKFNHFVYLHCSSLVGNPSVRSQDPGRHLHESLTVYINSRLRHISNELETFTNDEELVTVYVCYWREFWKACEELDRACGYLNRNWVKREQFEGHAHIHEVYRMAMIRWKELVFSPIDSGLVTAITLLLKNNVRRSVLYQALQSIVELYANDHNQHVPVPKKIENVFTADVVRFYKSETLSEFQTIVYSKAYSDFKHFLKYACLAMPEIEKEGEFISFLKDNLDMELEQAIKKSLSGKEYIQAFMNMRRGPLERALRNHKKLLAVIDQVCTKAINGTNQQRDPIALLNIYCNELMIKNNLSEKAINDEFKRIIEVAYFLDDKDKFIYHYGRMLRIRQIKETSASDGNETTMISLMIAKFGFVATERLRKLLEEMDKSRDVSQDFQNHLNSKGIKLGFDFRLKLFENRERTDNFKLTLPWELQGTVEEFRSFFRKSHSLRKIVFNLEISSGEILCNLGQSTLIFEVSTLQMAILLLFNHQDRFTVNDLVDRTGSTIEAVQPVLDLWTKKKLLITNGEFVEVNMNFSSRKRRHNLNTVPTKSRKVDKKEDDLAEKRKFQTDAAVVRLMKKYKTLAHSQLIELVIEELKNLFTPKIVFIKDRIDALLEKDNPDFERFGNNEYRYVS